MNFKNELMQEGRELKSRLNAYAKIPQTENSQTEIERLKCRLEMINLYLKVKYNILAY